MRRCILSAQEEAEEVSFFLNVCVYVCVCVCFCVCVFRRILSAQEEAEEASWGGDTGWQTRTCPTVAGSIHLELALQVQKINKRPAST